MQFYKLYSHATTITIDYKSFPKVLCVITEILVGFLIIDLFLISLRERENYLSSSSLQ